MSSWCFDRVSTAGRNVKIDARRQREGRLRLLAVVPMVAALCILLASTQTASASTDVLPSIGTTITDTNLTEKVKQTLKKNAETIRFIENKGQLADRDIRYYYETKQGAVFIARDRIRVVAHEFESQGPSTAPEQTKAALAQPTTEAKLTATHAFTVKMAGANPEAQIKLGQAFATRYNYFLGEDAARQVTGVQAAKDVVIEEVYPGIDLRLYSTDEGDLEFDWIVDAGVDFRQVKMQFHGQDRLAIDEAGALQVGLRFTDVSFHLPESYQVTEQGKTLRNLAFHQADDQTITFKTASEIDRRYPLVIDPTLSWGSFLEGNDTDFDQYLFAIQLDPAEGLLYCAGATNRNIPTNAAPYDADGYQNTITGFGTTGTPRAAIIYRLTNDGTNMVDLTLYGPSSVSTGNQTVAYGLSLSPNRVFIGGRTTVDIPTTGSPFDSTRDSGDGFVAVFSRDLGTLHYATYLGSSGDETLGVTSIRALSDTSYVVGLTAVAALPAGPAAPNYITTGADLTFGGNTDMYIAQFSSLNTLDWGTYVGGSSNEVFNDLEVFSDGRVAFAGYGTGSLTEVNSAAAQSTNTDNDDGILGVLNSSSTAFDYLDEIGGDGSSAEDRIYDVTIVDETLYWTGSVSSGFPVTSGVYNTVHSGSLDVVVGSVSAAGGSGYQATFYGSSADDIGSQIALVSQTNCGNTEESFLLVFGSTRGTLPTVNINGEPFYRAANSGGVDIFFAGFKSDLTGPLHFATHMGGAQNDYLGDTGAPRGANHLGVYGGNVYLGTTTHSATHTPTLVSGGFDTSKSNTTDDTHIILSIQFTSLFESDYSDAPASYGAPAHIQNCANLRIGSTLDAEVASLPTVLADGDDLNGSDDEDGVATLPTLTTGVQNISLTVSNVSNSTGSTATLYAWIDLNTDGLFAASEVQTAPVATATVNGTVTLTWTGVTVSGATPYLRVRLTTDALADNPTTVTVDERATLAASDGEVEDYSLTATSTPALSIVKTATPTTYSTVGAVISYSYLVTNSGNVTISGPITVTDNKTTATCPATASLVPNASIICTASYTITQADLNAGAVTNVASASGSFNGNPVTSPTDTETVTATQNPALTILKTANPQTYNTLNAPIGYSYLVTNSGNVTLMGPFTVTDNKTTATCPATASLAPNASIICTANYLITQADLNAGSVTNIASAQGTFNGNPVTSPTDTETVTAMPNPALSIVKTATPTTYNAVNAVISYSYLVTNSGNVTISGPITVTDNKTTATCPATASLVPNASIICTASYTITAADLSAGSVTNVALAQGTFNGNPVISPTDSETVTAVQSPALSLTKVGVLDMTVVTPTNRADVGDRINYTLTATNSGNVPLTNVTVVDPLLATLVCGPAQPASLPVGASIVCTGSYTLVQADINAGTRVNTATADSDQTPPTVTPNTVPLPNVGNPGLTITKSANPLTVAPYQPVTYTYHVCSTGQISLFDVQVTDDNGTPTFAGDDVAVGTIARLDPGACQDLTATIIPVISMEGIVNGGTANGTTVNAGSVIVATVLANGDIEATYRQNFAVNDNTYGTGAIGWPASNRHTFDHLTYSDKLEFAFFDKNGTKVLDFYVDALSAATKVTVPGTGQVITYCTATHTITQADLNAGSVTNIAAAHGFFGATPVNSPADTETVTAVQTPGLTVVKTASPQTYNAVNAVIGYSYLVTNSGNVTLSGPFTVTDDKTTNESCPATASLAPGASITCTSSYTITQADLNTGSVTNIAAAHGFFGVTPVNSPTDTQTVTAVQNPALTMVKTATPQTYSAVNAIISYSYLVTNSGNVTLSGPFTVTDDKATATCPATASLAPNASLTCTASYTITQTDITNGAVTNVASASGAFGNQTVTSPTDTETVTAVQIPALTQTKVGVLDMTVITPTNRADIGDKIDYTITATNSGNISLTNVTVVDPLLATLACGPAQPATLPPGASMVCTGSYTLVQADLDAEARANTATADSDQTPPTATPNMVPLPNVGAPGLTISKSANPLTAAPYESVTYSYHVCSTGQITLFDVQVTDDNGTPDFAGDDVVVGNIPSLAPGVCQDFSATIIPVVSTEGIINGGAANGATVNAGAIIVARSLANGDIEATYRQDFAINDNTYGTGAIGWPASNVHTFSHLTFSDKLQFRFFDKNGTKVLDFYMDALSATSKVTVPGTGKTINYPSGYGTLGPFGGDGSVVSGNRNNIVSFSTAISDNLNNPLNVPNKAALIVNSPTTLVGQNVVVDQFMAPGGWDPINTFTVVVKGSTFPTGFGSVTIPDQHNSPNKFLAANSIITVPIDSTVVNTATATANTIAAGPVSATATAAVLVVVPPLPSPWQTADIGLVQAKGSASYAGGVFTVTGSGRDIGLNVDEFRSVHQLASGDASVVARVTSIQNTDLFAKAAVMIRESLNDNAPEASIAVTPGRGIVFSYRTATGANTIKSVKTGLKAPYWVKIVRSGNTFTASYASDGVGWRVLGTISIPMGPAPYIGLGVTSVKDGVVATATFDNVTATP